MKKIAIIMGSDSDLPVAEKAINVLAAYAVPYEVHVFSAHRTLVVAKSTGAAVKSANLDGLDALLSTVQMPSGIPVATVAIDGAANAATLCVEMLAIEDAELAEKLAAVRADSTAKVLARNRAIEQKYNR